MSSPGPSRNLKLGGVLLAVVAGMVGLAFASVPLYRIFCQVTGFGGLPVRAAAAPQHAAAQTVTIRFNADVNGGLPWSFYPVEREMQVAVGAQTLAFYRAENRSAQTVVGTATFNVTPTKASPYFAKIACFCFTEQVLAPGQVADLPVSFFVDPALLADPGTAEVRTITLSYTFFRATDDAGSSQGAAAPTGRAPSGSFAAARRQTANAPPAGRLTPETLASGNVRS